MSCQPRPVRGWEVRMLNQEQREQSPVSPGQSPHCSGCSEKELDSHIPSTLGHLKPGRSRDGPNSFSTFLGSLGNISTLVSGGGSEAQRYLITGVWTSFPLLRGSSQYIRQPVLVWVPGSNRELGLELSPCLGGDPGKGRKLWMGGSRGTYSSTPLNLWFRAAGSRVGIILSITQLGKEKLMLVVDVEGLRRYIEGDPIQSVLRCIKCLPRARPRGTGSRSFERKSALWTPCQILESDPSCPAASGPAVAQKGVGEGRGRGTGSLVNSIKGTSASQLPAISDDHPHPRYKGWGRLPDNLPSTGCPCF